MDNKRYKDISNVCCVNCGERGHVVKDCLAPITSFGIIAFKKVYDELECKNDIDSNLKQILRISNFKDSNVYPKIKFLMIQRKDTIGYIDFIRGKYDENIKYQMNICFDEMTHFEKNNLLTQSFDTIWNNLWVNHNSKCFINEYELAKKKFNSLNIEELIKSSTNTYYYTEFGFPKGRKNMREHNIGCAIREFYEETGYNKECYEFIKNYPIIVEEFLGTNNIKYKHIYYLVKMKDNVEPPTIDTNNILQIGEVKNIGWLSLNESLHVIRPYDIAKKNIIKKVHNDLLNMKEFHCSNVFNSNYFTINNEKNYLIKYEF